MDNLRKSRFVEVTFLLPYNNSDQIGLFFKVLPNTLATKSINTIFAINVKNVQYIMPRFKPTTLRT